VVAPHSKGVIAMGERDFHPMSANFLLPHWLPSHWRNYAEGKAKGRQEGRPGGLAHRPHHLSSPRRQGGRGVRAARCE